MLPDATKGSFHDTEEGVAGCYVHIKAPFREGTISYYHYELTANDNKYVDSLLHCVTILALSYQELACFF